jgi:hypothetical protein
MPVRRQTKAVLGAGFAGSIALGGYVGPAMAAESHRVGQNEMRDGRADPENETLWYREGTTPGGGVINTRAHGAPEGLGDGALSLTTNHTDSAFAEAVTRQFEGDPLADVDSLGYWTFQSSAGTNASANAAFRLGVDTNGPEVSGGFTTLVFEPYWQDEGDPAGDPAPIIPDTWQEWDAAAGRWWSTRQITCGDFSVAPGGGGAPFTTPGDVATNCAGATVERVSLGLGSFNPGAITAVDGVVVGTTTEDHTFDFGPK